MGFMPADEVLASGTGFAYEQDDAVFFFTQRAIHR
jgi:hypothetical protein